MSGWNHAHTAPSHQRQSHHQRELGPGREGRHGDDAQQTGAGDDTVQAQLWGSGRHARPCEGLSAWFQLDSPHLWWPGYSGNLAGSLAMWTQVQTGERRILFFYFTERLFYFVRNEFNEISMKELCFFPFPLLGDWVDLKKCFFYKNKSPGILRLIGGVSLYSICFCHSESHWVSDRSERKISS